MKIIIVKPINDFKPGEIKVVADGYAKNFLIKNGYAKVATTQNIKQLELQMAKIKAEEDKKIKELTDLSAKLASTNVKMIVKAGEEDKLFGSVTSKDIAQSLTEAGFEIDKHNIVMEGIKDLGEHKVEIKLGYGINTVINVTLVKE